MDISVNFISEQFKPFLPDSSQVNPGIYGAELAWWLAEQLATKGISTSYPIFEDWGWFIEYINDEHEYWICCGNVHGTDNTWHVFVDPKSKGLFGRAKKSTKHAKPMIGALQQILEEAKEAEAISNINWNT